ncbi:helix-turn-helix domain-containing protein [Leptospira sp. GIMC2001]|uniref:helix-turn-helix domain-containing protein n=1 Tax=Leptospira sp. GIMC2001 TaxID=1513297 RepID=UPI00234BA734|nr:helix-turn-helix transcriptional regulator [Leptospira sp. GIMC2001]WCL51256.1 helix-turn-helix transcriptional regulator [Leptospira sp. GIMC2001]
MIAKLNKMNVNSLVGEEISKFRQVNGLTQLELASRLGMSRTAYNQLENGNTQISVEKLYEIAEILNVPVVKLLPGVDKEVDPSVHRDFNGNSIDSVLSILDVIKNSSD